jgi:high-affinity iron transporter
MDLQAFLITFREAFEAILIVGIIMTYLTRIGETKWTKWVWLGAGLAVIASFGVALLFQVVLDGYATMASQNYLRIGILLVSAGLLVHMVLFMSQQSQDMRERLQTKVALILTTGGAVNMIIHSFLVTLREGVETVFFFAAISGGDIQRALQSWGALLGVICAALLGFLVFRGGRRISLRTFFKVTGVFLVMIAAGLFVQAIAVMQDMRMVGTVFRTAGGEVGELYNIQWFMPEHPQDEMNYIRDYGEEPLVNGQIGIFFRAFLGYTHNPSVEEFVGYWGFYFLVLVLMARQRRKAELARGAEEAAPAEPAARNVG